MGIKISVCGSGDVPPNQRIQRPVQQRRFASLLLAADARHVRQRTLEERGSAFALRRGVQPKLV